MSWFEGPLPAAQTEEEPKEITIVDYRDYLRRDRTFGHSASAMVIAREAFENVHGWLEGFFPAEDNDMALRLGVSGRTILILSPATVLHRAHASNTINSVALFVPAMKSLLQREKLGCYPGGAARKFSGGGDRRNGVPLDEVGRQEGAVRKCHRPPGAEFADVSGLDEPPSSDCCCAGSNRAK